MNDPLEIQLSRETYLRGVTDGFVDGVVAERERIIELLKAHHKETKAGNTELSRKYEAAVLACIALIKGENK